jgi:hypothetical protein
VILPEVLGMAIGINLLFRLSEGVITVLDTFFYYCFLSTKGFDGSFGYGSGVSLFSKYFAHKMGG